MRYVSLSEEITREEIALNLLHKGMSVEDIASATQIPIEQVIVLQSRQK
jgi:hypothetical protein